MRQTSDHLKVVKDSEQPEEAITGEETEETEESEESEAAPSEGQALERSFTHLQPLMRPVQEAELSLVRVDPHLVTIQEIDQTAASQYNRLAIQLISGAIKNPPLKRVLITSAQHREGRTCVTLNLAAALARAKQRVLVVDGDMMRPSVNRMLGVETEIGLAEALSEGLPAELAVTRLMPISFDILPTRAQVENSAELLASPDFKAMLAALDPGYDFILFDSAPLMTSADASLLVLHTHATLMVVRPGTTSPSQMSKAVALLSEDQLFGVVLNRVPA